MSVDLAPVVAGFAFPAVAGWLALRAMGSRWWGLPIEAKTALGATAGWLALTTVMLLFWVRGIRMDWWSAGLGLAGLVVLVWVLGGLFGGRRLDSARARRAPEEGAPISRPWLSVSMPAAAVLGLVGGLYVAVRLLWIFVEAAAIPVHHPDATKVWAGHAKIAFEERTPEMASLLFPHYPPMLSLAQTWVGLCLGEWDETAAKMVFPFCLALAALGIFGLMRRETHWLWALAATAVVVYMPALGENLVAVVGDGVLGLVVALGLLHGYRFVRNGAAADAGVAGFYAGLCGWVKAEGLLHAVVLGVGIALALLGRGSPPSRWKGLARVVVTAAVVMAPWLVIRHLFVPSQGLWPFSVEIAGLQFSWYRVWVIARAAVGVAASSADFGWVWLLFPAALALNARRVFMGQERLFLVVLLGAFGHVMAAFLATVLDLHGHMFTFRTLGRLLLQWAPAAACATALLLWRFGEGRAPPMHPPEDIGHRNGTATGANASIRSERMSVSMSKPK